MQDRLYEIDHGGNEVYIICNDKRNYKLEKEATGYGFTFFAAIGEEGEEIIYERIN